MEGGAIALAGRVSADAEAKWTYAAAAGVDDGASCAFTDANRADTSISCTDDGTYTVTLTSGTASDTATVTVTNAAPVIGPISLAAATSVGREIELTAAFTDAGRHDTHSCVVDWEDGHTSTVPAVGGVCAARHTYATAGSYRPRVTVTDDDGGSATAIAAKAVTVARPQSQPSGSPSPSPSTSAAGTASPTATGGSTSGGGSTGGGLALTGEAIAPIAGAGLLLLGAGLVLYVLGRRRRTAYATGEDRD